jgi:hypothetical protein
MITQFKIFENERTHPFLKVGDYVKIIDNKNKYRGFNNNAQVKDIINNTIGQVDGFDGGQFIRDEETYKWINPDIFVKFHNLPALRFKNENIVEYASTKEELEAKLAAKKYNI